MWGPGLQQRVDYTVGEDDVPVLGGGEGWEGGEGVRIVEVCSSRGMEPRVHAKEVVRDGREGWRYLGIIPGDVA